MVKPTPKPITVNLPSDHPLFHYPHDYSIRDGNVLAERFAQQRKEMEKARRNAQLPPGTSRRWWQFWR